MARRCFLFAVLALAVSSSMLSADGSPKPFAITVVDDQTGRGVPLVELRTVNNIRLVTDSNGVAAFDEPGLMNQRVFFHVSSHGYEFPKDGFGIRGQALQIKPGGEATLRIKRINIAERLYRITGGGIYRDSLLTGRKFPLKEPALNGQVFGSDSVLNAVYHGKVYWFWGDTNRPAYPLGNFDVTGATTELPPKGLDPVRGIDLSYFVDEKGFARPMAKMPGKGPTWMTALAVLPDAAGRDRLYASYVKVEGDMKIYARGLMIFDDEKQRFVHAADVDLKAPTFPSGHAFRHRDGDTEFLYFGSPYPLMRVKATADDFLHPERYEIYTCLKDGSRLNDPQFDRDAAGKLRYAWKRDTPALGVAEQARLIKQGKLKPDEVLLQLRDRDTVKPVLLHAGSVYWNEYRRRCVMIAVQSGGTSFLGEVWYAEANAPTGPWVNAVKIVTHEKYSFYNPKQDPMFDKEGGRINFFEGTYASTFSGNLDPTPRYDYNQIMYKLDLGDARLGLAGRR